MPENTGEQDAFALLLMRACEAIADEVGAWLRASPHQERDPLAEARIQFCVSQLGSYLKSVVRLTKTRVLEAVRQGKQALVFPLDADRASGGLLPLAADAAGIGDVAQRLASHEGFVKLFNGYVMLYEGKDRRILFPPIKPTLEAIEHALEQATKTPSGFYVVAQRSDRLGRVTLQVGYPTYFVYELEECPVLGGSWQPVERTGRDQLVALLAHAYHSEHWFARQDDLLWIPR